MPRAATKKKDTTEDVPVEAVVEETTGETVPNAVIIVKQVDDDGSITTQVAPLGEVQATEVQTLIELGLRSWRSKIGLDSSA